MHLAFCLYKYFPYGGLQRDFLRIASACQAAGHAIRVYVITWEGAVPEGFEIIRVPCRALSNVARYRKFSVWLARDLAARPVDRVIGFNKMPGLDVYYAADACFEEKAQTLRNPLYRLSPRYRHFAAWERAVFGAQHKTRIMLIAARQQAVFEQHYGTAPARFHLLPPSIGRDRRAPPDAAEIRRQCRAEFGLGEDDLLLLQIGSGFKTKGLDRALLALAHLPPTLRARTTLIAIGQDEPAPFLARARLLGVAERFRILGGRDDIPRILQGGDVLVHPAYNENTGTVLLEAVVAGLPVLASGICGYAIYIEEAGAGIVLVEPFAQTEMDDRLATMLDDASLRARYRAAGLAYAETADIYDSTQHALRCITEPFDG